MLKTVFNRPDSRSTIFLSPQVTFDYLGFRLQVFVASLQQIPQLSHYMGCTGCGHFLLQRSSSSYQQLMCASFFLFLLGLKGTREGDTREGHKVEAGQDNDGHIACQCSAAVRVCASRPAHVYACSPL